MPSLYSHTGVGSHLASAGGPRTPDPTRPHFTTRRRNVVVRESRGGQSDVLTRVPTPGTLRMGAGSERFGGGRLRPAVKSLGSFQVSGGTSCL